MTMDFNTKGSDSEDVENAHSSKSNEIKRRCTDCQTTRTPCWRGGPAGPRTLCNACGIRQRKKKKALLGLHKGGAERSKKKMAKSSNSKAGVPLKLEWTGFRRDGIIFQEDWKRKLGEEEQAAILLMALSCGSVCA